jgi:hypothetical protein
MFKPGVSGNPKGRPIKVKDDAVIVEMNSRITPETIVDTIIALINDGRSWRARQSGVELYLQYTRGKPTQWVVNSNVVLPDDWLAAMRDEAPVDSDAT